jgi:ferredoxin-NADP reductase/MOSC domain-containing protein YiiM
VKVDTDQFAGEQVQRRPRSRSAGPPAVGTLVSVNVGKPQDVEWRGETVHTGIWKRSVPGKQWVGRLNIDGDGQGDLLGHGGEQRAVMVYQLESYQHWQEHFYRDDLVHGHFGENLTVDGLPDDDVCIGDRYRIGTAEFEVTQPRVTCYRVGLRLGEPAMAALLVSHHRPGFYLRVLAEGWIQADDVIVRTRRGPGRVSVSEADALLYLPNPEPERLRVAAGIRALSPGWQGSFRELLSRPGPDANAGIEGAAPAWPGFRRLRVFRVSRETETVDSVEFEAEDESRLPASRPGQYVTLRVPDAGQPAPVRSYSLASAPGAPRYRIGVKREPHGVVSAYLHSHLQPGAVVEVAAPRGEFVLGDGTAPLLLISAGIGITPMLAMLHALVEQRSDRAVWWLHGARNAAEQAFAREVGELAGRLSSAQVHVFYSAAGADTPRPADTVSGRLSAATLASLGLPPDATAYLCGPAGFMSAMASGLSAAGLDPAHVHTELFAAHDAVNPGVIPRPRVPPHQPREPAPAGPLVTFARSGLSTAFGNRWRSFLELAEACDVPTRYSCRTGVCQTCRTPLLAGDVRYVNEPLLPPPPDDVLICSSQPEGDVVLDM